MDRRRPGAWVHVGARVSFFCGAPPRLKVKAVTRAASLREQVVKEEGGKEEAWRVVLEEKNRPDADALEVPDLTPFTQYRYKHPRPSRERRLPRAHTHTHKLTRARLSASFCSIARLR